MSVKAATAVGLLLLAVALVLVLVVLLNLLPWILLALGVLVFGTLVSGLLIGALALIFAAPYYLTTKPARVTPQSSMGIDRIKEP
jgi:hypothetical protein